MFVQEILIFTIEITCAALETFSIRKGNSVIHTSKFNYKGYSNKTFIFPLLLHIDTKRSKLICNLNKCFNIFTNQLIDTCYVTLSYCQISLIAEVYAKRIQAHKKKYRKDEREKKINKRKRKINQSCDYYIQKRVNVWII